MPAIPDDQVYLGVPQVARLMGCHPQTVRRLIKSGKLAARKFGHDWRIHRMDARPTGGATCRS